MPGKSRSPSAIDSHLGYWLRHVSNQVSQAFARKVQQRHVTVAEWVVLRELYDADVMPSALAERLGMTRGAISKLADRLEAKRLLSRAAATTDGRSQMLALTTKGRATVPVLAALADENDREFFACLDRSTRETVETAMRDIARRQGLKIVPVD